MKIAKYIAAALAACVLTAGMAALSGCGEEEFPYDWSYLSYENGRMVYSDPDFEALTGVDVSEHQGFIDWRAVADGGMDFAVVRIGYRGMTEGGLNMDNYLPYNSETARAAGLKTCGYFFTQAITEQEAVEEAEYALDLVRQYPIDGFIAYDFEPGMVGRLYGIDRETACACARAFCERIEDAGYEAMIYANAVDLEYFDDDLLGDYAVWLADYTQGNPHSARVFECWQYTGSGRAAGFDTDVDINLWIIPKD